MNTAFRRIQPHKRLLSDSCCCGDTVAYVVGTERLCLACLDSRQPTVIPPLPAAVQIRDQLDPVGAEQLHKEKEFDHLFPALSVFTTYRILPGTEETPASWIKGRPWTQEEQHGYTLHAVLCRIRELIAEQSEKGAAIPVVVVISNYGYTLYTEQEGRT